MRWKLLTGKQVWKNDKKYRIDFDKPCRSKQQFELKQFLKKYCFRHILYEEYTLPGTILKVDFLDATKKIAWEHQGVGHNDFNPFFHNNDRNRYLKSIKNDMNKRKILELNGFFLIETLPNDLNLLSPQYVLDNFHISIV